MTARPTVSATMIVRNEERFLPGCLQSLRGRVDEIVVVDTGSSDRTVAIAKQAGARLLHHAWTGRFSDARNVAMDAATGDWVLYIDADERLRLTDDHPLGEHIDARAIAGLVSFRPKTGYTRYREWRLFRNDARLRFAGDIHETIRPTILAISRAEGLPIVQMPVMIDHYGHDGDQGHKHGRNLPLLLAAVRDDPARAYCRYHLCETLEALGRHDEALDEAHAALAAADLSSDEQRASVSLIHQFIARGMFARGEDPRAAIRRGLDVLPDNFSLWFLLGWVLLNAGEAAGALSIAKALRRADPDSLTYELLAFNRSIFGEKAASLAAAAAFRLGRAEEALDHARDAAALAAAGSPSVPESAVTATLQGVPA